MDKKEVKNVIDFYKLANSLKYEKEGVNQTVASEIYGSIILALCMNSEYKKDINIGKTITIILLKEMEKKDKKELNKVLTKLKKGKKYEKLLTEESNEKTFAEECINREKILNYFYEIYIPSKNIKESDFKSVYKEAISKRILELLGNSEEINKEILRFYHLNRILKKKERSGWNDSHWNILIEEREKVSEHVIGTLSLALGISSEKDFDIKINKVLKTLALHEIGEISIGDITPFDNVSKEEKFKKEHEAIRNILGNLTIKDEIDNLLLEFDKKEKKSFSFAYLCDKLDADLQSKIYEDLGLHHSLDEQENNKVFASEKVQKMLKDGAKTTFDIWYNYDKDIYKDNKSFTKVLKYAKNNKFKI